MELKDVKVADIVYGVGFDKDNNAFIVPRQVVALEANGDGEFVRFIVDGALRYSLCSSVEKSFVEAADKIKTNNPELACCFQCGAICKANETLQIGDVTLCKDCFDKLKKGFEKASAEDTEKPKSESSGEVG